MKQVLYALIAIVTAVGHSSCKKSCRTWGISGVSIWSNGSIPDTGAIVVQFQKSGDFANVADTFYNMPVSVVAAPNHIDVGFPVTSADQYLPYNYDWIIILLPSGKAYRIKNISHENKQIAELSIGMGGRDDAPCTNRTDFVMNDVSLSSKDGFAVTTSSSSVALRFVY